MNEWLWPILTGVGLLAAWIRFGYFWDDKLDARHRDAVREKMLGVMRDQNPAELFIFLFDRIFDPSGSGRPRIGRSVAASLITLALMLCVWWAWWPERADAILATLFSQDQSSLQETSLPIRAAVGLGAVAIGANIIGDVFSLWETRFVLGRMVGARPWVQLTLLVCDAIATFLMYFVGLIIGFAILWVIALATTVLDTRFGFLTTLQWFVDTVVGAVFLQGGLIFSGSDNVDFPVDFFAIFFYTAFFTSFWVWVFFLGVKFWPRLKKVGNLLNVYVHPLGAAMTLGAVFFGLVVTMAVVFWKLLRFLISL